MCMFIEHGISELEVFNAVRHQMETRAMISPSTHGNNRVFHRKEMTILQMF